MKLGLEVLLEEDIHLLKGQRVGLVTNLTGVNSQLVPAIDLFHESPDINLTALYGPEHGIRGNAKEGSEIASSTDPLTGLPVFSLYGESRKPTADMLAKADVLVLDLQDIGSRYYTYIYTMAYVMEACGEQGKSLIVLDRPNPIGGQTVEGNLLKKEVSSFVGMYPIPNRHSLTIGEMACVFQNEFGIECDLTVVSMKGWKRDMLWEDTGLLWVPSSPNTTGLNMCTLYPGTCLIEGTNLSEGRGTAHPFEFIGAPFIDGNHLARAFNEHDVPGILARPISFIPTTQKHEGRVCEGVQLHVTNRKEVRSLKAGVKLLEIVADLAPDSFAFSEPPQQLKHHFFDLLAGTTALRDMIRKGQGDQFLADCHEQEIQFKHQVKPYLLYS